MLSNIKGIAIVAVLGFVALSFFSGSKSAQTADLGQVLDRTEFALDSYQGYLTENFADAEMTDENYAEFTTFYAEVLNSEPRFYDNTLGLEIKEDASFLGFEDANSNGIKDADEGDVFKVEIDSENNRLIASDMAGNSSGLRFSGTGFLAGMFLGNLLNRQSRAGVKAGSFNNRTVSPRSAYKAPSSARSSSRSGGVRAGK